jgi:hypothetical protein
MPPNFYPHSLLASTTVSCSFSLCPYPCPYAASPRFFSTRLQVPLGGFANLQGMRGNQRFSIHKAYGDAALLPTAHTCFNQVINTRKLKKLDILLLLLHLYAYCIATDLVLFLKIVPFTLCVMCFGCNTSKI